MTQFLWPKAFDRVSKAPTSLGPVDYFYTPLSAAEISDLVAFWVRHRQPFPFLDDSWDCDDKGLEFFYWSRVWAVRRGAGQWPPPAVGMAYVSVDGCYELFSNTISFRGNHVLNVILRDDGQWLFFEPQTSKLLPIEGPIYESVTVVKIVL